MTIPDSGLVPVLHQGLLFTGGAAGDISVKTGAGTVVPLFASGDAAVLATQELPLSDLTVETSDGAFPVQVGGWSGRVDWARGGVVSGWLHNLRAPGQDQIVLAFDESGVWARAVARVENGGRFTLVLPAAVTRAACTRTLRVAAEGSDFILDGGMINVPAVQGALTHRVVKRSVRDLALRIKISCPNLKEAPMWGDYHFANSLAAAFERIDRMATVDTMDSWYTPTSPEDVVLAIRGRHRLKVDRDKINIMWLISHPDRIPEDEFADYDHIAVASDIYAAELRERGVPSVSVLHQATDATLFHGVQAGESPPVRKPASLFVGNSRREYRTMVKWCVQRDIPLELYGGGWEGVLPDEMVRGTSVANADLPTFYASHLMLLNDHWDSMRDNGFLSNRLFDGSAVGTPILTDPVAGLADVFGDTISVADNIEAFASILHNCLADPGPFLDRAARAQEIVLAAHTFDHRAEQIADLIDGIAAKRMWV